MRIIRPDCVKQKRRELDITQSQLAIRAGVSQSLITKIERGLLDPTFSVVEKISFALSLERKVAKDIMSTKILYSSNNLEKDLNTMKKMGISQLVISPHRVISEKSMLKGEKYEEVPSIPIDMPIETIKQILFFFSSVIVINEQKVVGVITRTDLL